MRKIILLIAMVLTAGVGAFLAAGYASRDPSDCPWDGFHLGYLRRQLDGLKAQLQRYRSVHGTYPTNDQGLTALDSFDARFALDAGQDISTLAGERVLDKREMAVYRDEHKHVPQSAQEFWSLYGSRPSTRPLTTQAHAALSVEVGISSDDDVYFLTLSGVLSPWLAPYTYENRNGVDPAKFADSPANSDTQRRYSVEVDDGIYVYSTNGQITVDRMDLRVRQRQLKRLGGVLLLAAASALTFVLFRSWPRTAVAALVLSSGAGLVAGAGTTTCYAFSLTLSSFRNPEMVDRQRELLDKYHQRGIIGDQAYAAAISGLTKPSTSQQADQSGE